MSSIELVPIPAVDQNEHGIIPVVLVQDLAEAVQLLVILFTQGLLPQFVFEHSQISFYHQADQIQILPIEQIVRTQLASTGVFLVVFRLVFGIFSIFGRSIDPKSLLTLIESHKPLIDSFGKFGVEIAEEPLDRELESRMLATVIQHKVKIFIKELLILEILYFSANPERPRNVRIEHAEIHEHVQSMAAQHLLHSALDGRALQLDALGALEPLLLVSDQTQLALERDQNDDRVFDSANAAILLDFLRRQLAHIVVENHLFDFFDFVRFGQL